MHDIKFKVDHAISTIATFFVPLILKFWIFKVNVSTVVKTFKMIMNHKRRKCRQPTDPSRRPPSTFQVLIRYIDCKYTFKINGGSMDLKCEPKPFVLRFFLSLHDMKFYLTVKVYSSNLEELRFIIFMLEMTLT